MVTLCCALALISGLGLTWAAPSQPPAWPKQYTVSGTIKLPYAEIEEPFDAYFNASGNVSRIDYYNGLVSTFQRGDVGAYGTSYKQAYQSNFDAKVFNKRSCFLVNGTADAPVGVQTVLPDLTGFALVGQDTYAGLTCNVWQSTSKIGGKTNTYTFWITAKGTPVRYEMLGYDSLLGSHFDKYYIDYNIPSYVDSVNASIFLVPNNNTCAGFPGPGASHSVSMNPIREFIVNDVSQHHEAFEKFKAAHDRKYRSDVEHLQRRANFIHNSRFVQSRNRATSTYTLALNHLADRTEDEMKLLRGFRKSKGYNGGLSFEAHKPKVQYLPDSVDWRLMGAVTPVKDQAVCGSCWSFGTVGAVEGAHFLKTGELVRLSQQELIDCSWGEGNNGCDGGEDFRAYQWIMKNGGLAAEYAYGSYLGIDGMCHSPNVTVTATMLGYVNVTEGDGEALKLSIYKMGPVSVAIDASHKSFSFYANGVYYEPQCGNTVDDLDHAVLAVGYGVLNGEPYWLVKNSWSTYWGNDGYVLMSQKNNNCGVATSATYVIM